MNTEELKALQQKALRRAQLVSIMLGSAAALAVIFMPYGFTQRIEAEKQSIEAGRQRGLAVRYEKQTLTLEEQLKLCQSEKSK